MRPLLLTFTILCFSLAACGPTKSSVAIVRAYQAIRGAEAAGAEKRHPYELSLAREYYYKAREEAGYSKYEIAERLAGKSVEYANAASGRAAVPKGPIGSEDDE